MHISIRLFAPLALLASTACVGGDQNSAADDDPQGESGSADAGDSGDGDGDGPSCTSPSPGTSPLRRLTRHEYNNTVRDLLGDETAPATSFVPEASVGGFDNQAEAGDVSLLLAEQYEEAAEALALAAVGDLAGLMGCDPAGMAEEACVRSFIETFGKRAYRRPFDTEESERYFDLFAANRAEWGLSFGVSQVIKALLMSPHFLYRVEMGMPDAAEPGAVPLSDYEIASRLSYLLWNSMPDDELFAAAAAGGLQTPAEIAAQAQRMLADERGRSVVGDFHRQWLELDHIDDITKDPAVFEGFTDSIRSSMRTETEMFIDDLVFGEDGTLETMLVGEYTFANAELANYYRVDEPPAGNEFERVWLDPERYAGILTQGGFLSAHSHANQTNPISRGVFVLDKLLCSPPPPPPPGVDAAPPEPDPNATTRERFAQHTADATCATCHVLIDGLGFGFEGFDGAGRHRALENGFPVDATGRVLGSDVDGEFDGVRELAEKLSQSQDVRACVVKQWFQYAYGRVEQDADECSVDGLETAFEASGGRIQDLLIALTQTDAFRYRSEIQGG